MEYFTVIDLGSNAVRMTISRINDDGSHQTEKQVKKYVRLSEGMGDENVLQPEAMDRTVNALTDFKELYSQYTDVQVKAVATAATRKATNQVEFLSRVKQELGIEFEVISGLMEANYDYLAINHTLPVANYVLLDTGGGSTEMVLVQNGNARQRVSLPIGSVSISGDFGLNDVVAAGDLFDAMTSVNDALTGVWWIREGLNLPIVGIGGSNRTLAKVEQRHTQPTGEIDVHGLKLDRATVNDIFSVIVRKNFEDRKKMAGINKSRADIIVGGLLPMVLLLRYLDSDRVIFSESGLRDGVLAEHLAQLIE